MSLVSDIEQNIYNEYISNISFICLELSQTEFEPGWKISSTMSLVSNINICFSSLNFFLLKELDRNEVDACAEFIANHNLVDFSKELVWQKLYNDTRNRIIPNFWSGFEGTKNENSGYESYREAAKILNTDIQRLEHYFSLLDRLSGNAVPKSFDQYQAHLSAILLSQIPPKFESCVNFFYTKAFRAFMSLEKRNFNFGKYIFVTNLLCIMWIFHENFMYSK